MVESKERIGFLTRVAYGSGDVACNIVYGMISTLLVMFYTDYAGVPAYLAGLVMLISRIFDGVSDVVMGYVVSKTHSRFGQSRPWIIRMALPYAIGAVLLFAIPQTNSALVQFLYMFITYNFVTTVCYTAINLPYGSLSVSPGPEGSKPAYTARTDGTGGHFPAGRFPIHRR